MPCSIYAASAPSSTHSFTMIRFGSLAIAWLLFLAAFTGFASAARPKEQRRSVSDPYLVSPPGTRPDANFRPAARYLGEREFVSSDGYRAKTKVAADGYNSRSDISTIMEPNDTQSSTDIRTYLSMRNSWWRTKIHSRWSWFQTSSTPRRCLPLSSAWQIEADPPLIQS